MAQTQNLEKRGDAWYFRGVINGKLYRVSTKFRDKDQARRRANEIETEIRAGTFGYISKPAPEFPGYAMKFLNAYHRGRATEDYTLQHAIRRWQGKTLDDINATEARNYFSDREADGAKKATLERERLLIKAVFRAAIDDGFKLAKNPLAGIKAFKSKPRARVMTPDEEVVIREIGSRNLQLFMDLILGTGLRSGEARGVRPCDLRDKMTWLHVRGECNKTRKDRLVPLRESVLQALGQALDVNAVARAKYRKRHGTDMDTTPYFPWTRTAPFKALQDACVARNIDPAISVHDLRRTFGSRCAKAGMYPKHLQMILGHEKIETTMSYYVHLDQMSTRDALIALAL